ncbi:MAG: hypothetical protein EON95_17250 [Caulobacteraceae bacterium]|nr:MAG: hypothetical protein EON95_17250 [Caulobacteraceae bacterium]
MGISNAASRNAPWPALFRRWWQYALLAAPAAPIAGLASWLCGGRVEAFWSAELPYLIAWTAGSAGGLMVALTLVWLMSRGSGLRVGDLEPERGRSLLLSGVALWIMAALAGSLHHGGRPHMGSVAVALWQMTYFNGLLCRRLLTS